LPSNKVISAENLKLRLTFTDNKL
jgi:hypothetical protein